ncbi:MAG: AmmeMemoRadiSam system protein B [Bacteroidales bacterium]|nr:AmmeMemoRadiSam system protein B [Bacteroidales bacterium]
MNNKKFNFYFLIIFLFIFFGCTAQESKNQSVENDQLYNRQPAFAGQFYPGTKEELQNMLGDLFLKAEPGKEKEVLAIISPHAGYVYSGVVAASSFNQVNPSKTYENVFVIASSHRAYYEGASLYSIGNYITPLGEVKVNIELANKLIEEYEFFNYVPKAHISEHSLEVQLPFLQYRLQKDFQIVPIVIGTQSKDMCKKMADVLLPYFNEENLFVISSDFSHFPDYIEANKWDIKTAETILLNDPDKFYTCVHTNKDDHVPNLSTRACGWTSVLTLLYMTENLSDVEYEHILYKNSGDTDFGDKNRVVGYNSIVLSRKESNNNVGDFQLTEKDKKDLLDIARTTVTEHITNNKIPELNTDIYSETLKTHCGAFVTLNKFHRLRGCIGRFDAEQPLYEVVQQMAIASSTQDTRFTPVMKYELQDLEVEISVLTPMKKINSIEEIELGKHGIYIKKGYRTGTFLPQVATETGWNLDEFLGHCARDKAGIGWDGWKDADIYIYEAIVFSESDFE